MHNSMKLIFTLFISLSFSLVAKSQDYLLITPEWKAKIEKNNQLAPLFYGVSKSEKEFKSDKKFVSKSIQKFNDVNTAFDYYYKSGWNFFNLGLIDSAIIDFNNCYLLKPNDERLIHTYGNILSYINQEPELENLSPDTYPNYKLIELFELEKKGITGQSVMIAFGNGHFYSSLRELHKTNKYNWSFNKSKLDSVNFYLDSSGNVLVKLRYDNDEGFYKQGIKYGEWVRFKSSGKVIDYTYNEVNGIREGLTTSYYPSGEIKQTLNHLGGKIEGEEISYTEQGEIISIIYWNNNQTIKEIIYRQETPWNKGNYILVSENGFVLRDEKGYNIDFPSTYIQQKRDDPITGENIFVYNHDGKKEIFKVPPKDGTMVFYPKGHKKEGVYKWKNGQEVYLRPLD